MKLSTASGTSLADLFSSCRSAIRRLLKSEELPLSPEERRSRMFVADDISHYIPPKTLKMKGKAN